MKQLAVSIPAYKRPALLRRALEELAPQCERHGVGLYVFDDSCGDDNSEVYAALTARYSCLRVTHNSRNLGIDRNIDQCISAPDAQYVWVIGEDDIVRENAIGRVLGVLSAHSPTYLFVNYQYISNDYATLLHVAAPDAVADAQRADEFFAHLGWATGFLGANVVNKARWSTGETAYMGTYFNHVGKIFSQLDPADTMQVIADPLVLNRAESLGSFTWLHDAFEVNAGFDVMLRVLADKRPAWAASADAANRNFARHIRFFNFRTMLVLRAFGVYNIEKYRRYMRERPLWWAYAAVAVAPVAPLNWLYRRFKSIKSALPSQAAPTASLH